MVDAIVEARTAKGAFTSFADFLRKVPVNVCNKRVIESLVKAGAFDSLGHPRKGLVLIHEQAIDTVIDVKRNEAIGQDSLFGGDTETEATFEVPVPDGEWDKATAARRSSGRCSACTCPTTRCSGVEHILAAATDCSVAATAQLGRGRGRARSSRGGRDGGQRWSPSAGSCPGCSAR